MSDTFDTNVGYSALVDQDFNIIKKSNEIPKKIANGVVAIDIVLGYGRVFIL